MLPRRNRDAVDCPDFLRCPERREASSRGRQVIGGSGQRGPSLAEACGPTASTATPVESCTRGQLDARVSICERDGGDESRPLSLARAETFFENSRRSVNPVPGNPRAPLAPLLCFSRITSHKSQITAFQLTNYAISNRHLAIRNVRNLMKTKNGDAF